MSSSTVLVSDSDSESDIAYLAVRLVALAETLGLVPRSIERPIARAQVSAALDAFARAGIGRRGAALGRHATPDRLARVVRDVLAAIEESPMPDHEWGAVGDVLGDELVARLVGTSVSSVRRYRDGQRSTPDDVAARLHVVALIIAELAGSYNEFGVRRWFQRSRSAFGGAAPADVLAGAWSPDDVRVEEVRTLAGALLGSPAT